MNLSHVAGDLASFMLASASRALIVSHFRYCLIRLTPLLRSTLKLVAAQAGHAGRFLFQMDAGTVLVIKLILLV